MDPNTLENTPDLSSEPLQRVAFAFYAKQVLDDLLQILTESINQTGDVTVSRKASLEYFKVPFMIRKWIGLMDLYEVNSNRPPLNADVLDFMELLGKHPRFFENVSEELNAQFFEIKQTFQEVLPLFEGPAREDEQVIQKLSAMRASIHALMRKGYERPRTQVQEVQEEAKEATDKVVGEIPK